MHRGMCSGIPGLHWLDGGSTARPGFGNQKRPHVRPHIPWLRSTERPLPEATSPARFVSSGRPPRPRCPELPGFST